MPSRLLGLGVTACCAGWALMLSLGWYHGMIRAVHPDARELFVESILFLALSLAGVTYFTIDLSRFLGRRHTNKRGFAVDPEMKNRRG